MNIVFKKLHIERFMSFDYADIDFDETGFTLISGENNNLNDSAKSNGSGKSSIWEALVWCLTGETIRGTKSVENIFVKGGTLVSVELSTNSVEYVITRCKNHEQYKTNLFLTINGKDNSGKGIRDTEKLLKDYLPDITASFLGSVIILGQGLPARFTSNTPSGRKEVLEKLSKSDFMIQDLKNKISSRHCELNTILRKYEDEQLSLNSKKSVIGKQLEDSKSQLATIDDISVYKQQLEIATERRDTLNTQYDELRNEYTKTTQDVTALETELANISADIQAQKNNIENEVKDKTYQLNIDISSKETEIGHLGNEITKLENIKDVCPTCGQKIPGVVKADTTLQKEQVVELTSAVAKLKKELNNELATKASRLQEVDDNYKVTIGDKRNLLAELKQQSASINNNLNNVYSLLDSEISNIARIEEKISSVDSLREMLYQNIEGYKNELSSIELKNNEVSSNIEITTQSIDVIKKFETIIKRDFRGILLTNVIDFINKKVKEYSEYVFDGSNIQFAIDGNNISISYQDKEYEMLSGGEKQKIDLIVQFAIRDMLCTYLNFDCNILVLDEIFDNLDSTGCSKIIDMISRKLTGVNSIYIISHHADELDIPADNYILVEKDLNGVSHLK